MAPDDNWSSNVYSWVFDLLVASHGTSQQQHHFAFQHFHVPLNWNVGGIGYALFEFATSNRTAAGMAIFQYCTPMGASIYANVDCEKFGCTSFTE